MNMAAGLGEPALPKNTAPGSASRITTDTGRIDEQNEQLAIALRPTKTGREKTVD
jgi:hypothetical protein